MSSLHRIQHLKGNLGSLEKLKVPNFYPSWREPAFLNHVISKIVQQRPDSNDIENQIQDISGMGCVEMGFKLPLDVILNKENNIAKRCYSRNGLQKHYEKIE